jgi:hypothetical protein
MDFIFEIRGIRIVFARILLCAQGTKSLFVTTTLLYNRFLI